MTQFSKGTSIRQKVVANQAVVAPKANWLFVNLIRDRCGQEGTPYLLSHPLGIALSLAAKTGL